MRRTAVHFCPAFWVMSVVTLARNCSNVSLPLSASGPSTAGLIESASMLTRTPRAIRFLLPRIKAPVAELPVKATASIGPSRSSRPLTEPARNWNAPSGSSLLSTTICAIRCASIALGVPAFSITGTPASSAHAIFSPMPQAGKLKALMCTATPGRGTRMCWPKKRGERVSCRPSPSTRCGVGGSWAPSCA